MVLLPSLPPATPVQEPCPERLEVLMGCCPQSPGAWTGTARPGPSAIPSPPALVTCTSQTSGSPLQDGGAQGLRRKRLW